MAVSLRDFVASNERRPLTVRVLNAETVGSTLWRPVTTYEVLSAIAGASGAATEEASVRHRYSEFYALQQVLRKRYEYMLVPSLPPKRLRGASKPEHVERRQRGLYIFMERIARNPFLRNDTSVIEFMERASRFGSEYGGGAYGAGLGRSTRADDDENVGLCMWKRALNEPAFTPSEAKSSSGFVQRVQHEMDASRKVLIGVGRAASALATSSQRLGHGLGTLRDALLHWREVEAEQEQARANTVRTLGDCGSGARIAVPYPPAAGCDGYFDTVVGGAQAPCAAPASTKPAGSSTCLRALGTLLGRREELLVRAPPAILLLVHDVAQYEVQEIDDLHQMIKQLDAPARAQVVQADAKVKDLRKRARTGERIEVGRLQAAERILIENQSEMRRMLRGLYVLGLGRFAVDRAMALQAVVAQFAAVVGCFGAEQCRASAECLKTLGRVAAGTDGLAAQEATQFLLMLGVAPLCASQSVSRVVDDNTLSAHYATVARDCEIPDAGGSSSSGARSSRSSKRKTKRKTKVDPKPEPAPENEPEDEPAPDEADPASSGGAASNPEPQRRPPPLPPRPASPTPASQPLGSAAAAGSNSTGGGSGGSGGRSEGRSDLLSAIRRGSTLREAVPASSGTGVVIRDDDSADHRGCGRGDLLSAIRRGSTLKKAPLAETETRNSRGASSAAEPGGAGGLMGALASRLEARRLSISQSNSGGNSAGAATAQGTARGNGSGSESESSSDSGWSSQ